MKTKYVDCECISPMHVVQFIWFEEDWDKNDKHAYRYIYLHVHTNHFLPWYKRLVYAFRYVFKMERNEGYTDVVLGEDKIKEIKDFLNGLGTKD